MFQQCVPVIVNENATVGTHYWLKTKTPTGQIGAVQAHRLAP